MGMLFADDIVLVDENREGMTLNAQKWREDLESERFRTSRANTKYIQCNLNSMGRKIGRRNECAVQIDDQNIPFINQC